MQGHRTVVASVRGHVGPQRQGRRTVVRVDFMTTPTVGDAAPDFSLPDTHGTPVTLSGLRGGPTVLVFVPFAFSGTCTGELCELRDNIAEFEQAGVHVAVISCDPKHAL